MDDDALNKIDESLFMSRSALLERLREQTQVLKHPLVNAAFEQIDRRDFVAGDYQPEAYEDYALPTHGDQTISQPTTVAFMLELLDAKEGQSVLDVGSGTGWTTALLGAIVGKQGSVVGLEIVPELLALSQKNIAKYKMGHVRIEQSDKDFGVSAATKGPFDRILANAAVPDVPKELTSRLKPGGRMVIPVEDSIVLVTKDPKGKMHVQQYAGFGFMPMVR